MIIEKNSYETCCGHEPPVKITKDTLFFDIETTGFSPKTSDLYMIGCGYVSDGSFYTIQWFDDTKTPDGEQHLLQSFMEFANNFNTCISFNGTTFDFPYIRKKCEHYHLSDPLSHLDHIDIYKKIKPYKQILGVADLKQKSIEAFLGICRNDRFSGGELISVYASYVKSKNAVLYHQLIEHNYDDLCGMIKLLPIMAYYQLFEGDFSVEKASLEGNNLIFKCHTNHFIEIPINKSTDIFDFFISAYEMILTVHGFEGTLKYFYPNPKDYFYLPLEDTAIHKSVAAFVDKDYRQKATKQNCYTRKSSFFLPQPKLLFSPEYRETAASKTQYFTWDTIENIPDAIHQYILSLFQTSL